MRVWDEELPSQLRVPTTNLKYQQPTLSTKNQPRVSSTRITTERFQAPIDDFSLTRFIAPEVFVCLRSGSEVERLERAESEREENEREENEGKGERRQMRGKKMRESEKANEREEDDSRPYFQSSKIREREREREEDTCSGVPAEGRDERRKGRVASYWNIPGTMKGMGVCLSEC